MSKGDVGLITISHYCHTVMLLIYMYIKRYCIFHLGHNTFMASVLRSYLRGTVYNLSSLHGAVSIFSIFH